MASDDLVLDLTNFKDTQGAHVAPGRYTVVVEDAELGVSTQKKTPQLTLWLRVVGGDYDGATLVENLYRTEASMFRIVAFLNALGIKTPKAKISLKLRQLMGRRVTVNISDDTYNGRTRSRVDSFERYIADGSSSTTGGIDLDDFISDTSDDVQDLPEEPGEQDIPVAVEKPAAAAAPAAAVEAEAEVPEQESGEPDPDPEPLDESDAEEIDLDALDI